MLAETHKKNWVGQHSELFYWTSYGQFKSKMICPSRKVSKITNYGNHNFFGKQNTSNKAQTPYALIFYLAMLLTRPFGDHLNFA